MKFRGKKEGRGERRNSKSRVGGSNKFFLGTERELCNREHSNHKKKDHSGSSCGGAQRGFQRGGFSLFTGQGFTRVQSNRGMRGKGRS